MISCAINIGTSKFFKGYNCTCSMGWCNFVVFEKFPFAYKHQIALKIMLIFNVNFLSQCLRLTLTTTMYCPLAEHN